MGEMEDVATGSVVSHYRLEERVGGGGMGVVYRARDLRLDRTVALKFLPPAASEDKRALGPPEPLFRTRLVVEGSESIGLATRYDVAPDGERFLIRYPPVDPGPPVTVVINWPTGLNP
jgi:serine/threonine protein kinase